MKQQQSQQQKHTGINPNMSRHTASTASAPATNYKRLQKKSEDGYLQIHKKWDPKAGKPLPPPPPNKRHNESITSTQSVPAYTHSNHQHNTFKPPNIPTMQMEPQLNRPHSHQLNQQRNMSMPHPNMPNMNRYNTVPQNIYQRNSSMPMPYQPNQIPMQMPYGHGPMQPNMQFTNPTHNPQRIHNQSYGCIPENRGVIELAQPAISETWATGKKESIIRPSKDTYKEPLLNDNDDIDYELDKDYAASEKPEKSGCCIVL